MLSAQNTTLSGGHSSEGMETHLGIVANGEVLIDGQWRKSGTQAGDVIVISKPLGTGVIMAADMQAQAPAPAVDAAMQAMLSSNADAMTALAAHRPTAVTDVTGFGLIGHLLEMLDSNENRLIAELDLPAVPLLTGAVELAASGWRSSLFPQLEPYLTRCKIVSKQAGSRAQKHYHPTVELLLDPQTSGGLLATLAADDARRLVQQSSHFVSIGRVAQKEPEMSDPVSIRLLGSA
jgi:selenide,water dikinase